jgi:hypothetical protein
LGHDGRETVAFTSSVATAEPRVAGRNVSVRPTDGGFELVVSRDRETLGTTGVPPANATVTAGGVRFERVGRDVFAVVGRETNGTRVRVASRERYR